MMTRRSRPVYAVDKITGTIVREYPQAAEADRQRGAANGTTAHNCLRRTLQRGRVCWRYADDYDARESYADRQQNRPVAVFRDGRLVGIACDAVTLAERLGMTYGGVHNALRGKYLLRDRYELRYLESMGQYGCMGNGRSVR